MGSDLFGIGISGLLVSQRSIATTGHNIANASTEGYSRQRAESVARLGQEYGFGFLGSGVETAAVRRIFDGFVTEQIRSASTSVGQLERLHELSRQVDGLLADPTSGLAPALQGFFSALHGVADDPSSLPARQVLLGRAEGLVSRFHLLDQRLTDMRRGVEQEISVTIGEINELAERLADLNQKIAIAEASSGRPANDLQDARDEVIRRLAERVDINTFSQDDGAVNVTIGGGVGLVIGTTVQRLSAVPNPFDPTLNEVGITSFGTTSIISNRISGGELAGTLNFRDQVLDPTRDALGRVALGLAESMNAQHRLGLDLDGVVGADFFAPLAASTPTVRASTTNTGVPPAVITAFISDVQALQASEYRLERPGAAFTLTRLADGAVFTLGSFPSTPETVDGITFSLGSGTIASGDRFQILPIRDGAHDIALAISDPRSVAAAAPLRTSAALGNSGTARISPGAVNSVNDEVSITFTSPITFDVTDDTTGASLASGVAYGAGSPISFNGWTIDISGAPATGDRFAVSNTVTAPAPANTGSGVVSIASVASPDPAVVDPVTITFNAPPTTFNVTGSTTGSPTVNVPFTNGDPLSFNGWTVHISGIPAAGDSFTLTPNLGGVGDNRNALLLADLQGAGTLDGGRSTFTEAYGQIVSRVGVATEQAEASRAAQSVVLAQSLDTRSGISGVNLDEEAANLLRLQQAFQASAQIINIANETFDSLLAAVAR